MRGEPHLGKAGVVPLTFVCSGVDGEVQFLWGLRDLSLQAKTSTLCQVSSPLTSFRSPAQGPPQTASPMRQSEHSSEPRGGISVRAFLSPLNPLPDHHLS